MLESVLRDKEEISVVDVSTQYINRSSKVHTREFYANKSTPDLLIAGNWNYQNNSDKYKSKIKYYAVVEIKIPKSNNKTQLEDYFKTSDKVIWTNCVEWEFYGKDTVTNSHIKVKKFNLFSDNNNWKTDDDEWNSLCKYIITFLNI